MNIRWNVTGIMIDPQEFTSADHAVAFILRGTSYGDFVQTSNAFGNLLTRLEAVKAYSSDGSSSFFDGQLYNP